ncbi:hypothetical protein ACFVZD_42380 [Streptomyces sp. NPDC058287]|uniref:hypothetical protein n=1 Tax=unclassified Streptomyces TaxID=2593676 RepID=UPI0036E9EF8F
MAVTSPPLCDAMSTVPRLLVQSLLTIVRRDLSAVIVRCTRPDGHHPSHEADLPGGGIFYWE